MNKFRLALKETIFGIKKPKISKFKPDELFE